MTYLISLTSLISIWLMGSKSKWGPVMGLVCQILWGTYIINTSQWGFAPGWVGWTVIQIRNSILWWRCSDVDDTRADS